MELFIKNMVCIRCKMIVKLELEKAGLTFDRLELGRVHITGTPGFDQIEEFRGGLINSGLELIKSKKSILIERIKYVIFEMLNNSIKPLKNIYYMEKLFYPDRPVFYQMGCISEFRTVHIR